MRFVLLALAVLASTAEADTLDLKKTLAKVKACAAAENLDKLGAIEKIETIGKRSQNVVVHLIGKKARGYAVWGNDGCEVIPVVGKPVAFAKGNFGNGATHAFALRGAQSDGAISVSVVTLKAGDKLLDLLVLPEDCEDHMSLSRRAVFAGRDSLELACYTSGGADQGRGDSLLDAADGSLSILLSVNAGIGWVQGQDEQTGKMCTARIPGGMKIVATGDAPVIDASEPTTPEEAEAAKVERQSGGCDATVTIRRHVFDATKKKFVRAKDKPRFQTLRKICTCRRM